MTTIHEDLAEPGLELVFDVYGETVTYTHQDQAAAELTGVYNPVHRAWDNQGVPVTSTVPTLDLRRSDLGFVPESRGDAVTIRGSAYAINEVEPRKLTYRLHLSRR